MKVATRVIIAGSILAAMILLGTWIGDRELPYIPERGEIIPQRAKPNSQISIVYYGKRNRLCPGTVTRTMIERCNGKVHSWVPSPSIATTQALSPDGAVRRELMLPSDMKPAENETEMLYCYKATTCYVCNPQQSVIWPICRDAPELQGYVVQP